VVSAVAAPNGPVLVRMLVILLLTPHGSNAEEGRTLVHTLKLRRVAR
jgi:hypothetical protein